MYRKKERSSYSRSRSRSRSATKSRSYHKNHSKDKREKRRHENSPSKSNHTENKHHPSSFQMKRNYNSLDFPSSMGSNGFLKFSYDRRNRNPHEVYKSLGGVLGAQDVTGIIQIDWKKLNLPKFKKNFYKKNSTLSHEEVKKYFRDNEITMRNHQDEMPDPILTFDNTIFPESLVKELKRAGFERPTPIQSVCWPLALSGIDVIAIAQTGSGKTLGFLMPLFVHIADQPSIKDGDGPIGLILAPTRELALQIEEEVLKFGSKSKISSIVCYGGVDKYKQKTELQRGCDLIISTPGRLIDFLEMGVTNLFRVSYLVLDEADRMLDMGFEPQIRKIISQIRPDRQTLMLSATWPKEVQSLARDFIKDPVHVQIGSLDISLNSNIKQNIEIVEERHKLPELLRILKTQTIPNGSKILIFCQTKKGCDKLSKLLKYEGFDNLSLHGDKSQKERDYAMDRFRNGRLPIVVATDLAARGLDVKDIAMVINYDFPLNIEDYVHRIGRTGRGGAFGVSYALFTKENERMASDLIKILEETEQNISERLRQISKSFVGNKKKGHFNNGKGVYRNSYNQRNSFQAMGSNNNYHSYQNNNSTTYNYKNYSEEHKHPEKSTHYQYSSKPIESQIKMDQTNDSNSNGAVQIPMEIPVTITNNMVAGFDPSGLYRNYYNPQAYTYLANMWSSYQQNLNMAGRLQCLITDQQMNPQIMQNSIEISNLPNNFNNINNNNSMPPVAENDSGKIQEIDNTNKNQGVIENSGSS